MSFSRTYNHAYALYVIENLFRNCCVVAALYNAIPHRDNLITAFFLLGLVFQLHPGMTTYIKFKTRHHPKFYTYLNRQADKLDAKLDKLAALKVNPHKKPNVDIAIDAEIYHSQKELHFINRLV